MILKHLRRTLICAALIASSAKAFWIIQIVSVEECSRLAQILMQIHCSTRLVVLNVTATQYTCSLNAVYHPHWLVWWSHCSHMLIPVHPPWLSGYISVVQTVLVTLTMAELFLDRPKCYDSFRVFKLPNIKCRLNAVSVELFILHSVLLASQRYNLTVRTSEIQKALPTSQQKSQIEFRTFKSHYPCCLHFLIWI